MRVDEHQRIAASEDELVDPVEQDRVEALRMHHHQHIDVVAER